MKVFVLITFVAVVSADHGSHHSTASGYGAAETIPLTTTAAPVYEAPTEVYEAPSSGYGAAERVLRTETISSPGARIAYNVGWSAPSYQRLVFRRNEGYAAASTGYEAPTETYSAPAGYDAPSETYGAPSESYGAPTLTKSAPILTKIVPESNAYGSSNTGGEFVERTEFNRVGDSKAFIKFEQNIEGSTATRAIDNEGNTVSETYADSAPNYRYAYGVEDAGSGDIKLAQEERIGENVKGSYSFMQPDGCQRTVNYFTDEIWNEVQYVVEYTGPGCAERYELPAPRLNAELPVSKLDANMFKNDPGYQTVISTV